jgi:translation initiation factor 1 (eIF-1/SUI1)
MRIEWCTPPIREDCVPNAACQKENAAACAGIKRRLLSLTAFFALCMKGKGVTVIYNLGIPLEKMLELSRHLKQRLGIGGSVKNNTIELQGDQRVHLVLLLQQQGYPVK